MSDEELCKALRSTLWGQGHHINIKAADRIEQLVATCEQLERERDHVIEDSNNMFSAMSANLEAAEAKFAKAVEALRDIAGSVPYADNPWHIALAALAELEGK